MSDFRDHLKELVDETALKLPAVTTRKMFGCYAWFARGQIFSLIWDSGRIAVRLPEPVAFSEALGLDGAEAWRITAKMKPMAHWVLLPEGHHDDDEAREAWISRAHSLAKPKATKAVKKKPSARKKK